jgi:microcystin-dependent protein
VSHFVGEIRRFARGLPEDWISCDGRVLPIGDHQPLFSLLGWRFGGDGRTTFSLPAVRSGVSKIEYGIACNGLYPASDDVMLDNAYVGEIRLFGGERAPAGWLLCDGRSLPIGEPFLALFDVIGTAWGGDAEHFAIPDLRGIESDGPSGAVGRLSYIIAVAGQRQERT